MDKAAYILSQKNDAGTEEGAWFNQMVEAFKGAVKNLPLDANIIDIGCYNGAGLQVLKDLGYTNLFGIDIVQENIQKVVNRGINGLCLDMHDLSIFNKHYFDFVFMSHSIEHAYNPALALGHVRRIAQHGLIIIPIEEDKKHNENPPHYFTFRSVDEALDVAKWSLGVFAVDYTYKIVERLSKEVWIEF